MLNERSVISWFSCGAASAIATWIALKENAANIRIIYIDTGSEHEDNRRFLQECSTWFGREIEECKSLDYDSVDDVISKRKFINSPQGAPCSLFLKKRVRQRVEDLDAVQVFGYTADKADKKRAERFALANSEVITRFPLIEHGITKQDCLAILHSKDIEIPAMYLLGYQNNNCIGCVKGGIGYWNKIRIDFPTVFNRRAAQEREVGHSILKDKNGPIWLDELAPERGNILNDPDFSCSLLCESFVAGEHPQHAERP